MEKIKQKVNELFNETGKYFEVLSYQKERKERQNLYAGNTFIAPDSIQTQMEILDELKKLDQLQEVMEHVANLKNLIGQL